MNTLVVFLLLCILVAVASKAAPAPVKGGKSVVKPKDDKKKTDTKKKVNKATFEIRGGASKPAPKKDATKPKTEPKKGKVDPKAKPAPKKSFWGF